ncbi:MFS transporter [Burkholderia orbicola]|uniref:MFS transporter n=1 Tax=Burkholderia orbicola TaxID=2978683 RepID=UPI0035C740B9
MELQANARSGTGERLWIIVFAFAFLGMVVDGADLMFLAYSLSSLKRDFGLTDVQVGSLGSLTLAGMALGGLFGGWAADRYGRVRTVVWTILVFSIGTMLLGFTQNYGQFAVARFVSALGLGAQYVVCNTLMAEYVPTSRRSTVLGALQAGWSVGYVVATLLAAWVLPAYGWRWLFYIAVFPVALAVFMRRAVPEPAAWLATRAARAAHRDGTHAAAPRDSTWRTLMAQRADRKMFIVWSLTAGLLQFGYYGVNNWLPTYLEREMNLKFSAMTGFMVGTYVAMILGKVIAGLLADRFGRRIVFCIGALGAAAFLPAIVLGGNAANVAWLLIVFGFIYGVPYGVNATYMTESFETKIRGTAVAGAYNIGRAGAAAAPSVIGFIATQGSIGRGFLLMGLAYFIAGVIPALFIPEKLHDPQRD